MKLTTRTASGPGVSGTEEDLVAIINSGVHEPLFAARAYLGALSDLISTLAEMALEEDVDRVLYAFSEIEIEYREMMEIVSRIDLAYLVLKQRLIQGMA